MSSISFLVCLCRLTFLCYNLYTMIIIFHSTKSYICPKEVDPKHMYNVFISSVEVKMKAIFSLAEMEKTLYIASCVCVERLLGEWSSMQEMSLTIMISHKLYWPKGYLAGLLARVQCLEIWIPENLFHTFPKSEICTNSRFWIFFVHLTIRFWNVAEILEN